MNLKRIIKKYIFKKNSQLITVGTLNESTRIHWLEEALKKIPTGSKILDAGAGEQPFKKFCAHLGITVSLILFLILPLFQEKMVFLMQ
jgi:hypothetical protein